jgi:putative holliday junction resolvase
LGRIAGIDYGTARIGIALSDERQIIASALGCLAAKKTFNETVQVIQTELSKHLPLEQIVIGLPLLLNGKDGTMAVQVRQLSEALKSFFSIPIVLWDERLTTLQVERFLKEQKVNRKKRSKIIDALAAQTILQNYLDSK